MKSKNTLARLREIESKIEFNKNDSDSLREERRKIEDLLLLPVWKEQVTKANNLISNI